MLDQVAGLHLKRPLVFFDLETTGTKVGVDRIVEMAMVKLMPDGSVIKKTGTARQRAPHSRQPRDADSFGVELGAWRLR